MHALTLFVCRRKTRQHADCGQRKMEMVCIFEGAICCALEFALCKLWAARTFDLPLRTGRGKRDSRCQRQLQRQSKNQHLRTLPPVLSPKYILRIVLQEL